MMKNFKLILGLVLITITVISCQKTPVASFTLVNTTVKTGEIVQFTNTSENGLRYEWDFGDGESSTITSPTHIYYRPGEYTVTLYAFSKSGKKSHMTSMTISVGTFWRGTKTTFTKADGADWTLAGNQDRLTDNVWITRQNQQGLFNIANEDSYNGIGPSDTEWALGSFDEIHSLSFSNWVSTVQGTPPNSVGINMVLHLISEDIYIEIKFTSWASGGQGGQGGFSYERSTK